MAPRIMLTIRVTVVAGIAIVAAGFWWLRSPDPDIAQESSAERQAVARRSPFGPVRSGSDAPVDRQRQASSTTDPNSNTVAHIRQLSADFSRRQDVYAKAARADRDELESMIEAARRSPDRESRRADLELLLVRYAQIDSEAALRIAMDLDRDTAALLVRTLAASNPELTWQRVAEVKNPLSRVHLQASVISAWVSQEPRRAYARVAGLPVGWERSELLEDVTAEVARQDPQLALDLIKGVEPGKATELNSLVAREWARFDPSGAARWVESIKGSVNQGPLAYAVGSAYVMQKPEEALAWALRISRSPGRNLWSSMLGELANRDPDEALRLAMSGETAAQRTNGAGAVLSTVALRDQTLAMSYLEKLPANMRPDIFRGIAVRVAQASPVAAFDWLDRTEDRRTRAGTVMQMVGDLAYRDVETAASLVDRVPREVREMWISNVARAYVDLDVDKAREWVKKYQDEVKRVLPEFARSLARRSPTAALEVANEISDEGQRDVALSSVLPVVAREDAERAVKWTERIGDETRRGQAVSGIAMAWSAYDQPAARRWLMAMPEGAARDYGLTSYLNTAESLDDTLEIVRQIRPDRRMNAVLMAAIRLKTSDPDAARTLLRRYPLDPPRQTQYEASRGAAADYYGNPFAE